MSPGEYYQLFGGPVATCRTFHLCQLAKWISVWVVHGDLSPSTVALIYVCFPAMLFFTSPGSLAISVLCFNFGVCGSTKYSRWKWASVTVVVGKLFL